MRSQNLLQKLLVTIPNGLDTTKHEPEHQNTSTKHCTVTEDAGKRVYPEQTTQREVGHANTESNT